MTREMHIHDPLPFIVRRAHDIFTGRNWPGTLSDDDDDQLTVCMVLNLMFSSTSSNVLNKGSLADSRRIGENILGRFFSIVMR